MMSIKNVPILKSAPPDLASVRRRSAAAQALHSLLGRGLDAVPDEPLLPEQRTSLGGWLFNAGPFFIEILTQDLLAAPGTFPDLQARAAYLAARQEEAAAWGLLQRLLLFTLDLVSDHHLEAQAECNREGQAIVKQIEASLQGATGQERERALDRLYAIDRARVVLRDYRGQPPQPARARPPKVDEASLTPRQQAARQRRKELILARLYDAFRKALRDWAAQGGPTPPAPPAPAAPPAPR